MIDDIRAAQGAALGEIAAAAALDDIVRLDQDALGRGGTLIGLKSSLGALSSPEERKGAGRALNAAIEAVTAALDERRRTLAAALDARVAAERLDLTEFVTAPRRGHSHPVTQAWERLEDVFVGLGFTVAEGPDVETDWYNFEALNMPASYPARTEFDTMFVDHDGAPPGATVLRTHVAGADPGDAGGPPAAVPRPRPGVPPGYGRHAHAGVPPTRRSRRRS